MSLEDETVSTAELAAMNISNRFTRTCDALEKIAGNSARIATSLEQIVALFACVIEMVEADGAKFGTIRVHSMPPGLLSYRNSGE